MNQPAITRLEQNTDLYAYDKVNILLVADGMKSARKVLVEIYSSSDPALKAAVEKVKQIEKDWLKSISRN